MTMIEVILPVKDRPEIETCVRSLLPLPQVDRILICDGGSQAKYSQTLNKLNHFSKVQVLHLPILGFNKSYLLNQGILQTAAEFVLISDADILWNEAALQQLQQAVDLCEDSICSVQQVEETNPATAALRRDRYTYSITQDADSVILNIQLATKQNHRPGCGLLYARRTTFLKVGGYKECFQGWGWEDQDLLIRAQILGMKVETAGRVLHLSHGDNQRNLFHQHISPGFTRNRNLFAAIDSLLKGNFWGDLPPDSDRALEPEKIQVYLPPELRKWLYESSKSIADYDLSRTRSAFENPDCLVATSTSRSPGCL